MNLEMSENGFVYCSNHLNDEKRYLSCVVKYFSFDD